LLRLTLGLAMFPHSRPRSCLAGFGGYGFTGTMGFMTGMQECRRYWPSLVILGESLGAVGADRRVRDAILAHAGILMIMVGASGTGSLQIWIFHELERAGRGAGGCSTI
jgi:putative oxidoreductase